MAARSWRQTHLDTPPSTGRDVGSIVASASRSGHSSHGVRGSLQSGPAPPQPLTWRLREAELIPVDFTGGRTFISRARDDIGRSSADTRSSTSLCLS